MPKFIVISGTIKKSVTLPDGGKKKMHGIGDELELTVEDAAQLNRKVPCVELAETHAKKAKAKADADSAIANADKEAITKLAGGKKEGGK